MGGTFAVESGSVALTANILIGSDLCVANFSTSITSNGYNVASDGSCGLSGTADVQNADPLLGPLQDNGDPTLTQLPGAESPALDRFPDALCDVLSAANDGRDQRGAPRPDGSLPCDSGSVEAGTVVHAWLLAVYASPDTLLEGQSTTLTAVASGPVGGELQYSFACPDNPVGPQDSPQATCFFPQPGVVDIAITVSESGPPVNADSASVTVTVNAVEVVTTLDPDVASFAEGGSYQGTGSFSTTGEGPWAATVDYGDESDLQSLGAVEPDMDIALSHQYLVAGDYTITLAVCDTVLDRCGTAEASVTVTAAQVNVTLEPQAASIGEGGSHLGTGRFGTDGLGSRHATVDYGDGTGSHDLGSVTPGAAIPISRQYIPLGDYTITLTICDVTVNRCGEASASVTVTAVAPTVTLTPVSLNLGQGATFQASGSFSNPGLGPWTATVDYGQGAGPQPLAIGPGNTFSLNRQYLQQGSFTVTVVVCDAADACGSALVTVAVGNVPPVIESIQVSRAGSRVTLSVTASDPGGGPLTYRFSCAARVIGPQVSTTASCDYPNQTGQFAVLVEVTDANQVTVSETVVVELPTYLCVGERSGTPRYLGNPGGCVRGEQPLVLTSTGSWSFCVGERSGSLRYLFNGGANCLRGEWRLTLLEQGPITVCVGERSQLLRYVAQASQCNVRGELVYNIAYRVP